MTAPERIWVWPEPDSDLSDQIDDWGWVYGDWDRAQPDSEISLQYVRADLFARETARAEAAEARLAEMTALLTECSDDLAAYVENDYPETTRAQYPSVQRRYNRDMELVYRARDLLTRIPSPRGG